MKRILTIFMAALLLASLAACGNSTQNSSQTEPKETQTEAKKTQTEANETQTEANETQAVTEGQTESAESTDAAESETILEDDNTMSHSDVLVAYFSATGTTKGIAGKIAAITGGDLYEIVPAEPYSDADLNWNDHNSRSTKEQNDKNVRPEIGSEDISLEGYTTVYLGFPIWWGEEPRILDTFVEKYSFEGITVIPFCTSGGSGIGHSGPNMEAIAGSGNWLDGKRFGGNASEADIQSWIEGLK